MATSDGTTLTDKQPPAKQVASSRLPGTPTDCVPDPGFGERIESLKKQVEVILKGTEWPSESEDAAKCLLDTVKSSPDIPKNTASVSQELQELVKQYNQTLEDVHTRLKDASSKYGMQIWKVLQRIKSVASTRPSKCTLLLQTCQDDVSKFVVSFNECLENERKRAKDTVASGLLTRSHTQLTLASTGETGPATFNAQTTFAEQVVTSTKSTSGASSTQLQPSSVHEDVESRSQIRTETLTVA